MFQRLLEEKYGISAEEQMKVDKYDACRGSGGIYLIVKTGQRSEEDLSELNDITNHLIQYGDRQVPAFIKTKEDELLTEWKGEKYCAFLNRQSEEWRQDKAGRKLAKFHVRGRAIPFQVQKASRIGQWKGLWEKRLDQMEKVWNGLLFQTPEDEFERLFIETFPYYMGLTENAIQYLVDTELDEEALEVDNGTVCHERFSARTWGKQVLIKDPFDWVFDHASRDLAEWTRERYFLNIQTYQREVKQFFDDYRSIVSISPFSWRLLYSRLLFPLHYVDCVESYYGSRSEQEKKQLEDRLQKILKQSREYELFLGGFFQMVEAPVSKARLPLPEWLQSI
ncbi:MULTISPECIES: spore coat putative kinase YutH [unclassified Bacillus (in: firmicutes)]|uniref:spore coat putative kinase YutH n=1 Tax=unclassified Bacillus (in: firmicutes) TaxID=185979 RepID=UPI0008F1BDFC|nr:MULTISPECIES: spore coat protein YutH [unclassified Bacillus (in: firmicutes)]SFB12683.1 spore coat protein YutH [Bacillus sp. UNCCL13]SFQ90225.1 spore coat protein YutH [Bacillus sp. cl95]